MQVTDTLAIFREVVTLFAAVAAFLGVRAWHRDFIGKRQIEMAEETLRLFYQARDALRAIRGPFSFGNEADDVVRGERESERRFEQRRTVAPAWKRYRDQESLFAQLQSLKYGFMARFGPEAKEPFDEIRRLTNSIFTAASMLVTAADALGDFDGEAEMGNARKAHIERVIKWEKVLWEHGKDDDFNVQLDEVISKIEKVCRSILDRRSRWERAVDQFSRWWKKPMIPSE